MRDTIGRGHDSSPTRSSAPAEVDFDAEHDPARAQRVSSMLLRRHVQKKAAAEAASRDTTHAAAERGTSSPTTSLPFADKIQASFGSSHDVSKIQAHVGGDSAASMGASAYASGNHVVFDNQPDLHTAAHEAAHVVQQAQGVNLYGGVGEAGDSYERHADAVADRVVAGQSAADLLGTSSATGGPAVVQKKDSKDHKQPDKAPTDLEARTDSDAALIDNVVVVAQRLRDARTTITTELEKIVHHDQQRQAGHTNADERGDAPSVNAVTAALRRAKQDLADLSAEHSLQLLKYSPKSEMKRAYGILDREIIMFAPTYERAQQVCEARAGGRVAGSFASDFRDKVSGDLGELGTSFNDLPTTGDDSRLNDKHLAATATKENVTAILECAQVATTSVHTAPAKVKELVARIYSHLTALSSVDHGVLKSMKDLPKAISAARAMAAEIRAAGLKDTGLVDSFEAKLDAVVKGPK